MKKLLLTIIAFMILLTSCSKDMEILEPEQESLGLDPIVTQFLTEGVDIMPEPPAFYKLGSNTSTGDQLQMEILPEGFFELPIASQMSEAEGIYLNVVGTEQVLRIPFAPGSTARRAGQEFERPEDGFSGTETHRSLAAIIRILATLSPGEFCVEYATYGPAGMPGEPESACLTVRNFGGNNLYSNKLWSLERLTNPFSGQETSLNSWQCSSSQEQLVCENGTYLSYEQEECSMIEKWEMDLRANGTFVYRENNRHKKLDEESSYFGCAPLYEETTSRQWSVGKWSFFSRDMDIVLLVVGSMDEAGNTYPFPDPYIAQFDIRNSSEENLELSKGARRYYLASK